ncbi:polysaccharide deacetylase family protein [Polycladomyces subterraneus]|uniref:Polysaccharide deacetylase family protein n=1 Tax=Polycladomyces subterraneus TaxID=1016997 RepID=A0ABT8ILZ2_9BACL|nr:polysaccharide deacetylase family protein [Polycladomyces subterraneus]MDN4593417.1 polysaccharide deacetylase family protein [Polycladomyces subterraneus]
MHHRKWYMWIAWLLSVTIVAGCSHSHARSQPSFNHPHPAIGVHVQMHTANTAAHDALLKQTLLKTYGNKHPLRWGEHMPGIYQRFDTKEKIVALTFDACGGKEGSGYDKKLIDYLIQQRIPATLFINSRWIDANPERFQSLARNPLFEIENHGYLHKPLSVDGRSVYGIGGTQNVAQVVDEVMINERKIERLTGRKPMFFRPGTAYFDDVAVKIVHRLGLKPVNYDVLGDAGATYNTAQVKRALLSVKPGSIVLLHMNQPHGDTAEGVIQAIPLLKKRGYRFVLLQEVAGQLRS